jgi:phospholipid/cholesterol/gamma-HCH transport system permease protein
MAFETIDRTAKNLVLTVQDYSKFAYRAVANLFSSPIYWTDFLLQADIIGVGSFLIVVLAGFFTGAVLAVQSAATLAQFGATAVTGRFVSLSMIRELGPVLTGIMVSGRNASSMASELGSMVVTEQIDAMRALGTDPLKKLVVPRMVATVVMNFFLTIISDFVGILGGAWVAVFLLGQSGSQYFHTSYQSLVFADVFQGLVKPVFFGFIIASIGCYFGMSTRGGTQGVGRSTTQAVVFASVLIIVIDFIITRFMIGIFGR